MNKREFVLGSSGAVLAGSGWAAVDAKASPAQSGAVLTAAATADAPAPGSQGHWQGRVGERFEVFGALQPAQLVLQRVDLRPGDASTSQFSLVFQAEGAAPAAGAQVLRPASGGALALFLAQAGVGAAGAVLMRADFCQLA